METTRALTKTGGITETGLKWIALVTMVMDHIHYFFGFTGMIPEWFSMVGRLGAPLFLFCLVEGFTHTHSRKKYFAKVYILSAAMSDPPPGLAHPGKPAVCGLSRSGHAAGLCRLLGPARMGHHRGQRLAGAGDGAGALPV